MRALATWNCVALLATVCVAVAAMRAGAQGPAQGQLINREYAIKAAFLYHFSTYVEWPSSALPTASSPFVIGVYQSDPFGPALQNVVEKKTVNGRPIEVRLIRSIGEVDQCQILFVPMTVSESQQDAVIHAAQARLVLVVGESSDFVERGGDVQFFLEGNKVRFAFSAEISKRGDLRVSSKLLSLAKIVPPAE